MATSGLNLSAYDPKRLPDTSDMKFGLVVAEWNEVITDALYQGALEVLKSTGTKTDNIVKIDVPGTFELVYGSKLLCEKQSYDAIIAIGTVIQGETRHFDFVCQGVTQGIQDLNVKFNTPVIFCVLTDNTLEQSKARSGGEHGNKGIECAVAAVKMAQLKREFHQRNTFKGYL
jgi:6,7-dimethyl-8-ribityllumazine synthase